MGGATPFALDCYDVLIIALCVGLGKTTLPQAAADHYIVAHTQMAGPIKIMLPLNI